MRTRAPSASPTLADQVRARSQTPVEPAEPSDDAIPDHIDPESLIPTGSTVLDLAMSDQAEGGYQKGKIDLLVGDSDTGKTMLVLTGYAECAAQARFDDYRFILDCVETNSGINIEGLLGKRVAARIEPPHQDKDGDPVYSDTVQDLQDNIARAFADGRPFLYSLDSWDALTSEEELDKLEKQRKAREKGKDAAGHMGAEKAKAAGQILRTIKKQLKNSDSHLTIIFQTRDNVGAMPFESKRIYSGGRAPKFYSQHEVWLSVVGQHTDDGTKRRLGVQTRAKIEKNHLTGKKREADFSIWYDYGVDDLGSCVDFLLKEGGLKKAGAYIDVEGRWGLKEKLYRKDLIKALEEQGLERRVRREVSRTWEKLEESLKLGRKPRFE